MRRSLIATLLAVLTLGACSSIDCPVQHTVTTLYALKKSTLAADTLKDTLFVVSRSADGDEFLLTNAVVKASSVKVPMSFTHPEDTLFFYFRNGSSYEVIDTVWVKKDDTPHFESVDCTASYFHTITAVRSTHYAIDSIRINNPSVTYDPTTEHFHLYLKPRS